MSFRILNDLSLYNIVTLLEGTVRYAGLLRAPVAANPFLAFGQGIELWVVNQLKVQSRGTLKAKKYLKVQETQKGPKVT